jgi:response regulator RpfG family c-di-GMP phosphodiesterase
MRRHILIVDDEELFREICREMLEERGYRVSVATDAPSALTVLGAEPVDLLVADITLPGMDGLTLVEQVHEAHPGLPAIVITGFLTQENMLRSLNLGVRGFLTKPFFYDELFVAVEKALEHSEATRNELLMHHYLPMIRLGEEILAADHDELFTTTLGTVLKIALQQTGATHGFVAVAPSPQDRLELVRSAGFSREEQPRLPGYLAAVQRGLAGDVEEVTSNDLIPGMNTLALRMPGNARRFGVLVLARPKNEDSFASEECNLARLLAVQAAIALHHHESHGRAIEGSVEAAQALTELAGALLPPEAGHPAGTRLAELADLGARVARALSCPPDVQRAVRQAVIFHNLGKVALPPGLLLKPSALDEVERAQMRTYPEAGAERLVRVGPLREAAPLVAAQRERWDGGGYPEGTKGTDIPLGARIVGVVGAWGAMRSNRPYRPELSADEAVAVIRGGAGTAYCPDVVEGFFRAVGTTRDAAGAT